MKSGGNVRTIVDAVKDRKLIVQIRSNEGDNWHKLWLYGFIMMQTALIILVLLVTKLSMNKNLKKYLPPPKF